MGRTLGHIAGWLWVIAVPAALAVSLWYQHQGRHIAQLRYRLLVRVDAFLGTLAASWGDPPDIVKRRLQDVLRKYQE